MSSIDISILQIISTHALREEGDCSVHVSALLTWFISTHALREEGDRARERVRTWAVLFLPTPSARRATAGAASENNGKPNFYPRPPRGGRPFRTASMLSLLRFLPTPSARRATTAHTEARPDGPISTHALREEGDKEIFAQGTKEDDISTHALREEGDKRPTASRQSRNIFLPTPSARRATGVRPCTNQSTFYFYPRPPRGGRPANLVCCWRGLGISTHALREEGDPANLVCCWRGLGISTHALREEGDKVRLLHIREQINFYPRPPRGGRHCPPTLSASCGKFLPTPSARRATSTIDTNKEETMNFYPRPPRGGRLCPLLHQRIQGQHFYPRPPRGGRHPFGRFPARAYGFLPTPSARRATHRPGRNVCVDADFYPRPPRGGRPGAGRWLPLPREISTHALREEGDLLSVGVSRCST